MAIKNKDGTTYRLRGPNPLMIDQDWWESDEIVLHNMNWRSEKISEKFEVEKPIPEIIPDKKEPDPPAKEPERINTPKKEEIKISRVPEGMFVVDCLPARIKRVKDDLFGSEYATIQYGNRFQFEAGLIDSTDIELVVWATRSDIEEGSILFPRDGRKRWWKVVSSTVQGVGYAIRCIVSDEQPSFD